MTRGNKRGHRKASRRRDVEDTQDEFEEKPAPKRMKPAYDVKHWRREENDMPRENEQDVIEDDPMILP